MEPAQAAEGILWGIRHEAWAIIWATFFGPVAAVLVTRWRDSTVAKRDRWLFIFRILMATRRQTINVDHVTALNLIEVDFYGVKPIEAAWRTYIGHLNSGPIGKQLAPAEQDAWDNTRADLLAKLLAAISSYLGYRMGEIDLRNGGYAPEGWRYRDLRAGAMQEYVLQLATGKNAVPVASFDISKRPSQHTEEAVAPISVEAGK
jgi:hypothetical protein